MPVVRIRKTRIGRASSRLRHDRFLSFAIVSTSVCADAFARVRMDIPQPILSLATDFRSKRGDHSNRCSPLLIDVFVPRNQVLLPDHSAHVAFAPERESWTQVATHLQGLLNDAEAPCHVCNRGITTTIFHRETRCGGQVEHIYCLESSLILHWASACATPNARKTKTTPTARAVGRRLSCARLFAFSFRLFDFVGRGCFCSRCLCFLLLFLFCRKTLLFGKQLRLFASSRVLVLSQAAFYSCTVCCCLTLLVLSKQLRQSVVSAVQKSCSQSMRNSSLSRQRAQLNPFRVLHASFCTCVMVPPGMSAVLTSQPQCRHPAIPAMLLREPGPSLGVRM